MTAGELCTRNVIVATRNESIVAAARRMRDDHVGNLVVVDSLDNRMPIGILTDRDIVLHVVVEGGESVDRARVSDAMSRDLVSAHREDSIEDVLARMTAGGVRRIPIVDDDGCLFGVLAVDDLVGLLSEEVTDIQRLVTRERERERVHFSATVGGE